MTKLNAVLALEAGAKQRAHSAITSIHHMLQKTDPLTGISRVYRPKDEDGDQLPSESKRVQVRASSSIGEASAKLCELFDVTFTKESANCSAKADIVVDGKTLLSEVPATYLLFLEKQLADIRTFVEKLPTLDPGEKWAFDESQDCYATEVHATTRTKKIPRAFIKYEATKEHPAQVETFTEDVVVGFWDTVKYSGALPAATVRAMLERVERLQDAVRTARHRANELECERRDVGGPLLKFVFGENGVQD